MFHGASPSSPSPFFDDTDGVTGVFRLGALGDMVADLPRFRFLARRHGGPVRVLAHHGWAPPLFAGIDYIDGVDALGPWRLPYWLSPRQRGLVARARRAGMSRAYVLESAGRGKAAKGARLARRAGVKDENIRFELPEWFNPAAAAPRLRPQAIDAAPAALVVTEDERAAMRARLAGQGIGADRPLVLAHPGNSRTAKRRRGGGGERDPKWWPPEHWRTVLAGVRRHCPEAAVILTGTAAERTFAAGLAADAGGAAAGFYVLAGATGIRELLALQSLADSILSVDTGPAHTAVAVGCPAAVLFATQDPRFSCCPVGWGPVASVRGFDADEPDPSRRVDPRRAMRTIRPETLLSAWRALPPRPSAPPSRCLAWHYREGVDEPERREVGVGARL